MSSESPAGRDISSPSPPDGGLRWLRVPVIVAVLFIALLRWAIDVLLLVCVLVLVAHSTRDTLHDWLARESFEDEPNPIWAVGAVCIGLVGVVISGFWLLASSEVGARLVDRYVPPALTATVAFGERLGWGGRAFWPGASRFGLQGTVQRASSAGTLDVSTPGSTAGSGSAKSGAERGGTVQVPPSVSTAGRLAPTATTLRLSTTSVEQGMAVTLTAEVTASNRPSGAVVFRRGPRTLGTVNVGADGRATLVLSDLPAGTHDITAEFTGSSTLRSSRSAAVRVIVR